jgi:uncharacterized protein
VKHGAVMVRTSTRGTVIGGSGAAPLGAALVTGASSGIGAELALVFARHGHDVVLLGRDQPRLVELAGQIERETGQAADILVHDLMSDDAVQDITATLAQKQITPAYIVNAAGFGLFGMAGKLNVPEQLAIIDVNCRALTELTLRLLPHAIEQGGGVLNVSSVGGFLPGPGMAVYFASKAYVQSFTQALRSEYRERGLRISVLCPGPVATRFQARAGMLAPRLPRILRRDAADVALAGYNGLMRDRAIIVPGFFNLLVAVANGMMFNRLCAPLVRRFHLKRSDRPRPEVVPTASTAKAQSYRRDGR